MSANREMLRSDDFALTEPHVSYRQSSSPSTHSRILAFKRYTDSLRQVGQPSISPKSTFLEIDHPLPLPIDLKESSAEWKTLMLDYLRRFATNEPTYSGPITSALFRHLLNTHGNQETVFDLLVELNHPMAIWHTAVQEYHKVGGSEILSMAASLLGHIANRNPSFLVQIIREDDATCEFLPYMIASRKSMSLEARKNLLTRLTQSKHEDVREVAQEALDSLSP
jgi:hypothetical protein